MCSLSNQQCGLISPKLRYHWSNILIRALDLPYALFNVLMSKKCILNDKKQCFKHRLQKGEKILN